MSSPCTPPPLQSASLERASVGSPPPLPESVQSATLRSSTIHAAEHAAKNEVRQAKRRIQIAELRLAIARTGVPHWAVGLAAGSVAGLIIALVLILVLNAGIVLVLMGLVLCYGVLGGGSLYLLRPEAGETDANRVERRVAKLDEAKSQHALALQRLNALSADAAEADRRIAAMQAVLQSDAHRRQMETHRLLAVDPGRLYPDEFERYVAEIFTHLGFTVELAGKSGDQGVDVLACRGQLRLAIQAKRYLGAVGNSAVQEVFAGMAHRQCHRCMVVTNSTFTPGAVSLAASTGCILIGGDQLPRLIGGEIAI